MSCYASVVDLPVGLGIQVLIFWPFSMSTSRHLQTVEDHVTPCCHLYCCLPSKHFMVTMDSLISRPKKKKPGSIKYPGYFQQLINNVRSGEKGAGGKPDEWKGWKKGEMTFELRDRFIIGYHPRLQTIDWPGWFHLAFCMTVLILKACRIRSWLNKPVHATQLPRSSRHCQLRVLD